MSERKTHHFFLRTQPDKDGHRHPRGVVALERVDEDQVRVAVSLCSVEDEFNRKEGVNRARGRLLSSNCSTLTEGDEGIHGLTYYLLADDQDTPGHGFRSAAGMVDWHAAQRLFTKQVRWVLSNPTSAPDVEKGSTLENRAAT